MSVNIAVIPIVTSAKYLAGSNLPDHTVSANDGMVCGYALRLGTGWKEQLQGLVPGIYSGCTCCGHGPGLDAGLDATMALMGATGV